MNRIIHRFGLLFILLLAILVRLPNLNRPLSKHHEFNTAVVLINAESWQQSGGGSLYAFTPLMNYAGQANKVFEEGLHIDSKGNHVYLSFGPGWYILPYFIFQIFQISASPLAIQVLNLLIYSLSLFLLYFLLKAITTKKEIALAGTFIFAFLPAPLWYGGNGYVNTVIMLPLVLFLLLIWHRLHQSVLQVKWVNLGCIFFAGCGIIWFDWFGVFILVVLGLWALVKAQTHKAYYWVLVISALSVFAGILLVIGPFAHYLGWQQVGNYWKSRFVDRSVAANELSLFQMLVGCAKNLAMGFFPVLFFIPLLFIHRNNWKLVSETKWPLWALTATIPYNFLFLSWSSVHEFAWLAFGLMAIICLAVYLFPIINKINIWKMAFVCFLFSVPAYYLINLPGSKNLMGARYNVSQNMGNHIQQKIPNDIPLFCNLANQKIVEYYAKRTFTNASTFGQAVEIARFYGLKKAAWLNLDQNQLIEIRYFEYP